MGKKHNSGNPAGRSGRTDQPSSSTGGSGFYQKFNAPRGGSDRPSSGGDRERPNRSGDAGNRNGSSDRPAFGRGPGDRTGGFGGPKKFGGPNKSGGSFGRSNDSGGRPYGNRPAEGGRGFERGGPRRDDDRRGSNFGGPRREDDRPVRPFSPKKTWEGQPYRQEGRPAVPRGGAGERNRKFIKSDPNQPETPRDFKPRDTSFDAAPRTDSNLGPDREIRPARPFDFRGRPEGFDEQPAPRRERDTESGDRTRGTYGERREGGFGTRSTGERSSFGTRSFTDRNDRKEGGFGASRSFGERDARPERPAPTRFGRDASTPNRADKLKRGEVAGQAPDYKNLKHYEDDKNRGNKRRRQEEESGDELRLNRYIANAGVCSRREADSLIAAGEIKVNGEVVTEMGYKVLPTDTVQYGKTNLNREKLVYVLLNKPKDTITTTEDPEGRRTVMDLIKESSKERIFPVGRLDRNTTGLLLFTNDGEVAQKLSHPSHRNKKIYQVELDKPLTEEHLKQIAAGVELEDGKAEVDDVAVVAGNAHFVGVEIHIGRNRIVRRIFEHLGYDVVTLDRVQYAGLTKKDLPRGKWRFLNEKEVIRLKYFM
ncbi:rRNA pseudouridine synthase [Microvirga sp. STR05]|uniref:Pseudouridine synthase n=1 Tax=Hymenobacter duratus TaxID=2771356 RepID=A0ABR8JDA4_9BACT|nr:pseudouridine synthase [Hymenobacter duratus]MBD2713508.1 rRNA pseudouridine synthase [Hymenobacter duratus]MBR7948410.1 rRNA pseudouridine synthase [Microvirga sp. STR05]